MSLLYLTVTCDLYDGSGTPASYGAATFTPSAALTDVADGALVTQAPVTAAFGAGGFPAVTLLQTDSPNVQPPGWAWQVALSVPGHPPAMQFLLPAGPASFTATDASPAVFTIPGSTGFGAAGIPAGTGVQLAGGSLPAGFSSGTTYYVVHPSGLTFQLAATPGGSAIASTSTGSGTVTAVSYHLSAVTPVQPTAQVSQYMPPPSGTPAEGAVPVATGAGEASAWTLLTAASVGADVAGAAAAVSEASRPDQVPALEHGLTAGAGFTALLAAIAGRNSARVDIPVIGDSTTAGHGATTFAGTWVQQANRAIRAAYPTTANGSGGGLGFIPIQTEDGSPTYTWPITVTSGSTGYYDAGPIRASSSIHGTWTGTFTAPAATTSVQVMYNDSGGQFSYKVGSGSATTVTLGFSNNDVLSAPITISGGQVLTLAWVSGGVSIDGIVHFAGDEASGITFHGCGRSGWMAGTEALGWNQAPAGDANWAQCYANGFTNTQAMGIYLGGNDAATGAGNRTAAQFQSDLAGLISTLRGAASILASVPLLLIADLPYIQPVADPGGWPAYVAAIRAEAAADGNAHVIDLSYRMAFSYSGPLQYDQFHPSNLGHALIGEIIAAGVRIA